MTHICKVGDLVLAAEPIVTTPTDGVPVRVEIPSASYGVIAEIEHNDDIVLYVVDFKAGTGSVRVWVTPCQVTAPLRLAHRKPYEPTQSRPHQHCARLHPVYTLLLFGAYGLLASLAPEALIVGLVFLAAVYGHQLLYFRTWTWIPLVFRAPRPHEGEVLVVSEGWTKYAVFCDGAFVLALATLLLQSLAFAISRSPIDTTLLYVALALVAVVGAAVMLTHDRAARICPKDN